MYWITSFQLTFGLLFARRTLQQLQSKNLINKNGSVKLFGILILGFLLITDATKSDPRWQMLSIFLTCAALLCLPAIFEWRLKNRIQSEFPAFISKIILEMKSGFSFRSAIGRQLGDSQEIWEQWLRSMIESRVFLRAANADSADWWTIYLQELQAADENSHLALTRLENFREKLCILSEFRRKSGQALAQARIQMLVMTFLYLALLMLTMTQFQFAPHRRTIFLSLGLFLSGQAVFWWMGRKRAWKI